MKRERMLQVALGLVGLVYVAMIYPLYTDLALFIRLLCHRGLIRRCHDFTHCIHENGTARNSEPLGPIRPGFDSLLWLSRNAQALALLLATTTLR